MLPARCGPAALAGAELTALGLTRARSGTIRHIAGALLAGRIDLDPSRPLEETVARWVALPGIGPWTAQYIALRALGHPDALPAEDLVLRRVAAGGGPPLSARELRDRAEAWRPFRAYAVMQLWSEAAAAAAPAPARRTR